jgi:hypothetical protein
MKIWRWGSSEQQNYIQLKLVLNPKEMQYVIDEDLCLDSLYNLTLTTNVLVNQTKKYKRQYHAQP